MNAPGHIRKVATLLLLLAVTLIGGGLRVYAIGRKGLWLDEAFSVWLGWHRLPEMWGWIARIDQHPPLYYTLLNVWMRLGDDVARVRLLSAIAGTLTIPLIFVLGRRLIGPLTGLTAALLLAVSPFHVRFAQEARMYALLTLAATAAMVCLAYLLARTTTLAPTKSAIQLPMGRAASEESQRLPQRDSLRSWPRSRVLGTEPLRASSLVPACGQPGEAKTVLGMTTPRATLPQGVVWAGYVVFSAAAMLTHSTALLLPVATNLFVLGLIWRRRQVPPSPQVWGEEFGVAKLHARGDESPAELEPPRLRSWLLAQAGVLLLWGAIWLPAFISQGSGVYHEFWMPAPTWRTVVDALGNFLSAHLPRQRMAWLDAAWLVYAALVAVGIAALRKRPAVLALLLTLFLTPLVGELLVSLRRPVFYDRTLIWATIPLYVMLAAGIAALRRWLCVLVAVAILVTANGVSLREYYVNFSKEGWKEAAAYVGRHARDSDLILFNASWIQIPFDFYFRAAGKPAAEHGLPADLFDRGVLEPRMTKEDLPRLRALIRGRQRVWLVYSHNWYTDPQGLIPVALSQELAPTDSRSYEGLQILLYEGAQGN